MIRLSWAMRLVVFIGSGLLVAAAIAIALTVPAPASPDRLDSLQNAAQTGM